MNVDRLSPADSFELLKQCSLGRLGCIADGSPYVVPITYYFDGKDIYSHATPGKKIEAMRVNPRVTACRLTKSGTPTIGEVSLCMESTKRFPIQGNRR